MVSDPDVNPMSSERIGTDQVGKCLQMRMWAGISTGAGVLISVIVSSSVGRRNRCSPI